ncbi:hypothetical protein LPJ61_001222 [Coemansia biformis]|uniref:Elongator complex protein 5 n=1 Tax=Coemansia biformis TaxID=1286918 RepID=A0A9W7YAD8_9FUNG|nr:hypothetical protein LPJ61_001222 [Coemansia biformis]
MAPAGLAIQRIAAHQHYAAPLVVLSDTPRQAALPLLEAMVRESLGRGLRIVAVCVERRPSADIARQRGVTLVDHRPAPERVASGPADLAALERDIRHAIRATDAAAAAGSGVVVVFEDLQPLLDASRVATLALLRSIRCAVQAVPQSRVLARTADSAAGAALAANALRSIADAVIETYPLDALRTWMPGWYSDGRPASLVSVGDNDCRRCLVRLEHKKQSGKVGHELSMFEADEQLRPKFALVHTQTAAPAPGLLDSSASGGAGAAAGPSVNLPFSLGLTEKQRQDKAGVELPYLQAQLAEAGISGLHTAGGGGGGEIHYQLDAEDDWDEDDPDDDLEL